ncbi:DUF6387 family protein [Photobacterium atrarenae]|uniref:DUF6387 family protein n=1 Tax=Photobacterium atrarenae TaxID=865757 RepID=A0ABY5GFK4_9GAMM|nr:DUF6387 family protein [Photobacterium atrarenae]UTV27884.1 DUF6387 family protein [Photobacterium atrarenae]
MQSKQYSKHAILADKLQEQPSLAVMAQITAWFNKRNYSFATKQDELGYARELEIRLHILQNLTFHQLYVSQADNGVMQYWKFSCLSGNANLASFERDNAKPQGNLVTTEKPDNLQYRHELANLFKEPLPELVANPTLEEIQAHSEHVQLVLKRQEYLCPIKENDQQILLSVNLAGGSNKAILNELQLTLNMLRDQLAVPEPAVTKRARDNKTLAPYVNKHALEYLDLLIYCIHPMMTETESKALASNNTTLLRPAPRHIWELTDSQIAQLIDQLELDSETIKKWRVRTFEKKLLDSEYIRACLLSVKTEALL